jgi:hypothetical protein
LYDIEITKPDVIVVLGNVALQGMFPEHAKSSAVKGKVLKFMGIKTISVTHPAQVLHSGSQAILDSIIQEFKLVRQILLDYKPKNKLDTIQWEYIKNEDQLGALLKECRGASISIDTEANTLDPFQIDAHLLCVGIAVSKTKGYLLVVEHKEASLVTSVSAERALKGLYKICITAKRIVFHNAQFDVPFIRRQFLKFALPDWTDYLHVHCSMIQHYAIDPNGFHNLQMLAAARGYPEYDLQKKAYKVTTNNLKLDTIPIDAKIESELSELTDEERTEYLTELGIPESGLDKIIHAAYKTLGLITFITAGPKESKAWTCTAGSKAPQAAGKIHTDFEKGFIRAEVIQWDKLLEAKGYVGAKEKGWLRVEGKEYVVQDGDVVHFRFTA